MHALRRECGHRMVTGSVASDMGVVTGARGWKPLGNLFFLKFPNSTQICRFKKEALPCSKNTQTFCAETFEYFEQLSPLG
jgi:hypothetical protein